MQFPLLYGCLLCPARSLWSIRRSGASVGLSELSLAGLGIPAIGSGGSGVWIIWGVAILIGSQISSIVTILRILFVVYTTSCLLVVVLSSIFAPGSIGSSGSTFPLLSSWGDFFVRISVSVILLALVPGGKGLKVLVVGFWACLFSSH